MHLDHQSITIQAINSDLSGYSNYDFPVLIYKAQKSFSDTLREIIQAISEGKKYSSPDGSVFDLSTPGGITGIGIYTQSITTTKDVFVTLGQAGLSNEKKLWTFS